jgi:hypothetical protein
MSQMPSAAAASRQLANPLTNPREVAGFFIAYLIRAGCIFLLGFIGVLNPLYAWAFRTGHGILLTAVSGGVSVIAMLIMLPIFLAVRGGLGGTPPMVSGAGGAQTVTSNGAEIGAYLLGQLIGIVALLLLSGLILAPFIYAPLGQGGHKVLTQLIATTIGLVIAVVVFFDLRQPASGICRIIGKLIELP